MKPTNCFVPLHRGVHVDVCEWVLVARTGSVTEILPAQEPRLRRGVPLESVGVRLGLAVAIDDNDGLPNEEQKGCPKEIEGPCLFVDEARDLECVVVVRKRDQRKTAIGNRRVQDGVEVIDERLGSVTR